MIILGFEGVLFMVFFAGILWVMYIIADEIEELKKDVSKLKEKE